MDKPIFIKAGKSEKEIKASKRKFQLRIKTDHMEVVVTEIEPVKGFGKTYSHPGEEIHMIIKGKVEFVVDDMSYIMEQGDWLWHPSRLPHHARNLGKSTAKYITIGVPPTFM